MIDHDRLFKKLLSTFFVEFIELFFPAVRDYIEPDSVTFLPQEIFSDIISGDRREVDLLVQVKYRGQDSCFIIHVENQSYPQSDFAMRMFTYFARLHEKYKLPVYPVALFSYEEPKREEVTKYQVLFPDFEVLNFNFKAIQLNRLNWRTFLTQPNPVAAALMSKMNFAATDRARVKLECLRMLATLRLNPAKTKLISGFVDTYLRLNPAEEQIFRSELETLEPTEENKVMEIVTSWMEQGIQQGRQQGIQQGETLVVLRQLQRRFGTLTPEIEQNIRSLPLNKIEELAEALLDFSSFADLNTWLDNNIN